ncbi:Alpha/Beta hydrolase protein [Immersiella caudata]|uniref:Alpha/Beta hydrolase protein n=1 Tax=Immersiella caudata TaxID=314043 RepID=A0AA40CDG3_9PEZI|nr:Alpha/Beta hydrolase protein [Immersiella caudata]
MASLGNWTFTPFPSFPATIIPNFAFWNATDASQNLTYQIGISWPFEWESPDVTNKTALTMYITDGNAYGLTAAEHVKRRKPVDSQQPDTIVVTIGYPLTNHVYDLSRRFVDLRPPLPVPPGPGPDGNPNPPPAGADNFIAFIDGALRPWVQNTVFPSVTFTRDALYGHSFGGVFAVWALIAHPGLFDTYIIATPTVIWNNGSLIEEVTKRWGVGSGADEVPGVATSVGNGTEKGRKKPPAVFITYGSEEQFPVRRRTETQAEWEERRALWQSFRQTDVTWDLFYRIQDAGPRWTRDVRLKEYVGQDHAGVAASTVADGVGYFADW